jgi:cytochrome c-type biogenesis protein CcmH
MMRTVVVALLMLVAAQINAANQVDVLPFDNDVQRERYRGLINELRCPKCLNTNIAGSDAPIAKDLRILVHRFVVEEAKTDQEILDYLHARYGDFVLYDPPFNRQTWWIWLLPVFVGGCIFAVLARMRARGGAQIVEPLTTAEQQKIDALKLSE